MRWLALAAVQYEYIGESPSRDNTLQAVRWLPTVQLTSPSFITNGRYLLPKEEAMYVSNEKANRRLEIMVY